MDSLSFIDKENDNSDSVVFNKINHHLKIEQSQTIDHLVSELFYNKDKSKINHIKTDKIEKDCDNPNENNYPPESIKDKLENKINFPEYNLRNNDNNKNHIFETEFPNSNSNYEEIKFNKLEKIEKSEKNDLINFNLKEINLNKQKDEKIKKNAKTKENDYIDSPSFQIKLVGKKQTSLKETSAIVKNVKNFVLIFCRLK